MTNIANETDEVSNGGSALNDGLGVCINTGIGDDLRKFHKLDKPRRYPLVGEIVEVDGVIGICTEHHKGWCYVRQSSYEAKWLDFISDEARHGKCEASWKIRDDL